MATTRHLSSLDSEEDNAHILNKLPRYINDRWSRIIDRWLNCEEEERQCYLIFGAFCDFLDFMLQHEPQR